MQKDQNPEIGSENTHIQLPNLATKRELLLTLWSEGIQIISIHASQMRSSLKCFFHVAEYEQPPTSLKVHLPHNFSSGMVFQKQISESYTVDMGAVSSFPLLEATWQ